MKNITIKKKTKEEIEKARLKKYKQVQKQVIASLTKTERTALGL